jgi:hypothetical protein
MSKKTPLQLNLLKSEYRFIKSLADELIKEGKKASAHSVVIGLVRKAMAEVDFYEKSKSFSENYGDFKPLLIALEERHD